MKNIKNMLLNVILDVHKRYESKALFDAQAKLMSGRDVKCIIDAGAAKGDIALEYRKRFRKAVIYCFEPFEAAYCQLLENMKHDLLIKPRKLAISNISGQANFFTNEFSVTNSLLKTDPYVDNYWAPELFTPKQNVVVSTVTLDDFCDIENILQIDILKMDIQGGEITALSGAKKLISQGKILLVYTEILMVPTYEGQPEFIDFLQKFREFGFELFNMGNFLHDRKGQLKQCDAVFINQTLSANLRRRHAT